MGVITLENESLRLQFNADDGALAGVTAPESGWRILDRPHLGLAFKLVVPLPGRRYNPVWGEQQILRSATADPDGAGVTFAWDELESQFGGRLPIALTLRVRLVGRTAIFQASLDNRSELVVENVYYPYLGDVRPPPGEEWFKTFQWQIYGNEEWSLWPVYQNLRMYQSGEYLVQYAPTPFPGGDYSGPLPPFMLLRGARQGLYVGRYAADAEVVTWHTELRPGWDSFMNGRVPDGLHSGEHEVSMRFAAAHVPFVAPGEKRDLTPIALAAFQGSWQAGVDIYKQWRTGWMKRPRVPAWLNEPHAWRQLGINSPEDDLNVPYQDLVKYGEDCARHGVAVMVITGWNLGGQDRGYPSHATEPRLGTFADLKQAIVQIRAMGVRVVLFTKFTWADRGSQRFRDDLIRLAIKDPHGDYYLHPGYMYRTATQLLDINTTRLVPMCFLAEEYLRLCEAEFQRMLELNPDGILFDECVHHSPALLCFDPSHGHAYGAPVYANDRKFVENLSRLAAPVNAEFMFAGEALYDWLFEAYHVCYQRSRSMTHVPLTRYLHPEAPMMTTVLGFNDRHMLNQCLLYRYIACYEPMNYRGRLADFPLTMAYGRQMDALRTELREYFWDGELHFQAGATVTVNGQPHHPYSVFASHSSGQLGVVVVNYEETSSITAQVRLEDGSRSARYRLVDDRNWHTTGAGVVVPARSAAVVIP